MKATLGAVTVGKIPDEIWSHQKWFIGKLQIPVLERQKDAPALIYDKTRKWSLYIPVEWTKMLTLQGRQKAYYWMWFTKEHAIQIEEGTPVEGNPYW